MSVAWALGGAGECIITIGGLAAEEILRQHLGLWLNEEAVAVAAAYGTQLAPDFAAGAGPWPRKSRVLPKGIARFESRSGRIAPDLQSNGLSGPINHARPNQLDVLMETRRRVPSMLTRRPLRTSARNPKNGSRDEPSGASEMPSSVVSGNVPSQSSAVPTRLR